MSASVFMPDPDLRTRIKEMLVKNLMLQTTPEEIADDLPLFGPNGLGLDSIDALELVVSMEKTFGVGVPNSEGGGKALKDVNPPPRYQPGEAGRGGARRGTSVVVAVLSRILFGPYDCA